MITHIFTMSLEDIHDFEVQFCFEADDDDLSGLTVLSVIKEVDYGDVSIWECLTEGAQAAIREACEEQVPEALAQEAEYRREISECDLHWSSLGDGE